MVLDWHPAEVNNQVGYADVVLIQLVVTHLSMEVRRLGAGVE